MPIRHSRPRPRPQSPRLRRPAPAPRQLLAHAPRCGLARQNSLVLVRRAPSLRPSAELLRFSSAHTLLAKIPEELQRAHRQDQATAKKEPELVVNTAKHRAIARADKKRGAASSQSQPAAPRKPVDLWAADDDDDASAPFLDLSHGDSLASLGL